MCARIDCGAAIYIQAVRAKQSSSYIKKNHILLHIFPYIDTPFVCLRSTLQYPFCTTPWQPVTVSANAIYGNGSENLLRGPLYKWQFHGFAIFNIADTEGDDSHHNCVTFISYTWDADFIDFFRWQLCTILTQFVKFTSRPELNKWNNIFWFRRWDNNTIKGILLSNDEMKLFSYISDRRFVFFPLELFYCQWTTAAMNLIRAQIIGPKVWKCAYPNWLNCLSCSYNNRRKWNMEAQIPFYFVSHSREFGD